MKISIKNFKSIGLITDFEIKPLTILSGNNSVGKSSFIQLLLLLKQTIELDSTKSAFLTQGKYYYAKNQIDLIKDKLAENDLEFSLLISKSEFDQYGNDIVRSIFDSFPEYTCRFTVTYNSGNQKILIKKFSLVYSIPGKDNYLNFERDILTGVILVDTNNDFFVKGVYDQPNSQIKEVFYSGFFPNSFELINLNIFENPGDNSTTIYNEFKSKEFVNIDPIKSFITKFFNELNYIGPLRVEPKDAYPSSIKTDTVGVKGENVAQILEERKDYRFEVPIPTFGLDGIIYNKKEMSLLEATNYWMCDVFKFAKDIYVKDIGESYSIILVNNSNIETSIKHVGFGISQILPIIVQGILLSNGGTLILEQPEIHLHPKAQSLLFDFLYSLILQGKNVIIETHSDHFITRMRRRIAEDETSKLGDNIKLTFIEQNEENLLFRTINLDEYGITDIFPEDFIERPEIELKALLKAQMKKRISNKSK